MPPERMTGHTPEAEALADAVLRAAGSGLRFHTMPSGRAAIIAAAQKGIDAARACNAHDDLVKALEEWLLLEASELTGSRYKLLYNTCKANARIALARATEK